MMFDVDVSIKQLIKAVDNKTNEEVYFILSDDDNEWHKITEEEYNKIRG